MAMFDLKVLNATLDQLESEKKIPREDILDAIEQALAAAYKKDYGKRGQIVRSRFNNETGDVEFYQVKIVVDDSTVKPALTEEQQALAKEGKLDLKEDPDDERVRFDGEKHMYIDDAKKIKADVALEEEIIFPLELEEDFGRIAAQTAKQVIIQRIREAEKRTILQDYADREGEIVSGVVQKFSHGMVFVDLGRATGAIATNEKIPGEFYKTGQRIKCYLYQVEETPKGIMLKLSRSHPRLIEALFALESPEIAAGTVEIKAIAREAGARSKIAVISHDTNIDPIGACVGQKGIRVATVISELSGEKIDIVPWAEDTEEFISNALSPARVLDVRVDEDNHVAHVEVADDQLSLAIGKEGQNVRLAAKLTGWKIDIAGVEGVYTEEEGMPKFPKPGSEDDETSTSLKDAVASAAADEDAAPEIEASEETSEEEVIEENTDNTEETTEE